MHSYQQGHPGTTQEAHAHGGRGTLRWLVDPSRREKWDDWDDSSFRSLSLLPQVSSFSWFAKYSMARRKPPLYILNRRFISIPFFSNVHHQTNPWLSIHPQESGCICHTEFISEDAWNDLWKSFWKALCRPRSSNFTRRRAFMESVL